MKQNYRKMQGVTLLEIMLVLAIAAVIITMSIRYFQSASAGQRMTTAMSNVQAIVGAVENYRLSGKELEKLSDTTILPYVPGGKAVPSSPWSNDPISITNPQTTSYTLTMDIPTEGTPSPCSEFKTKLEANGPFAVNCGSDSATIVVTTG